MRNRWLLIPAVTAALAAGVATAFFFRPAPDASPIGEVQSPAESFEGSNTLVHLYFLNSQGTHLTAETESLPVDEDPERLARALVQTLLEGPRGGHLAGLPSSARLLGLFIVDGAAYVDLSSEAAGGFPGGVRAEYLSVMSLVNTLCLNVREVSAVQFLMQGKEVATLGGHVDVRFPLGPDMTIIR